MPITAAVVLAGCGRADGAEITEAVSILVHLARHKVAYKCFAPDRPQLHVVNHASGKPAPGESRNCMVEAARISRGEIAPLDSLDASKFETLLFAGGFGVAKNLCDFATAGAAAAIDPDVTRVIKAFHAAAKPIGLCCIAPVLAAQVLGAKSGGPGCEVTIGHDPATAAVIDSWGSRNVPRDVRQAYLDTRNRVVTSPAYMDDAATPYDVFTGIGEMVDGVVALVKK